MFLKILLNYFIEASKKRSECPLSLSLNVFGDKWSLLIIRDLLFFKKCTYNDFLKSDEGISTNILASRLKALEENYTGHVECEHWTHFGHRKQLLGFRG